MIELPGYIITEQIYRSDKTLVVRGQRASDRQPVVIKLLNKTYPSVEELSQIQQEYIIPKDLNCEGVVQPLALETYQHGFALVLEDFGGRSLATYLQNQHLSLADFLRLAVSLAQALENLHQAQIVHKDIKPSNIIFNPHPWQVKLTDFSIAMNLPSEDRALTSPKLIEGTLAYMSPEQTGRMNRSLDYRTDFYSLGITFYEILTGTLPFVSNDPLELVHAHIAKQPLAPATCKAMQPQLGVQLPESVEELPSAVSDIVLKLLEKNAEDRYQSAAGLGFDLEQCLVQLRDTGNIEPFPLGTRDREGQLLIPQKLYGREAEVQTLLTAFDRIAVLDSERVRPEIVLVSGYSGVGKTSIVREVYKPIVASRGYFTSGKFDQFRRDIPYSAIVQAFQELIRQILTESDWQIEIWRKKLMSHLGNNAQVAIDVIPELELIIGPQPKLPEVGTVEAQNRFNQVFPKFVQAFCQPEHPLAIFLDDLQWADAASLKLLQLMAVDESIQSLLLIGAYRDNEVSPLHPLTQTLENIATAGIITQSIAVKGLEFADVQRLIADTINWDTLNNQRTELAELLFNKTHGNPLFLTQLLKTLHVEKLLVYDPEDNTWKWDIVQIQTIGITDLSIIDLIARNMQLLPEATQQILRLAACIGNQFNLKILSIVNQQLQSVNARHLWPALQAGLILPIDKNYRIPLIFRDEEFSELGDFRIDYRFLHDRIQQAAYSLIPDTDKQATHLQIGQLLLQSMSLSEQQNNVFAIANQLNLGRELLETPESYLELAALNLQAGQRAKRNTAYEAANTYLQIGLSLLPPESWETQYNLMLALTIEAAEAAYLIADFSQASNLVTSTLARVTSLLDRIPLYELQIKLCMAQNLLQQAVDLGMQVLAMLEVKLVEQLPADLVVDNLASLPIMQDPFKQAAMRILVNIQPAVFILNTGLALPVVFTTIEIARQHGNSPFNIYGYSLNGWLLCGPLDNIELGYQYGLLSLKLLDRLDAVEFKAKAYSCCAAAIFPWKISLRDTVELLYQAVQSGLETGDLEFACHAAIFYCEHPFLAGENLEAVLHRQQRYLAIIQKCEQEYQLNYARICTQLVANLLGKAPDISQLSGDYFDESTGLPAFIKVGNANSVFYVYFAQIMLAYLLKDVAKAVAKAELAEQYTTPVLALAAYGEYIFFYTLALLAHYAEVGATSDERRCTILAKANELQQKLATWAMRAPSNYQHKYNLVEAERLRLAGEHFAAMEYYDRAIAGAKEHGFLHHEAIANELTGEFYLALGREKVGRTYLIDAYYAYARWQAAAKVSDLEARYPYIFDRIKFQKTIDFNIAETISTSTSTTEGENLLDLPAAIKSAQAISEEIILGNLLKKLLKIALENAGAQRGLLVLRDTKLPDSTASSFYIQAEGTSDVKDVEVLQAIAIERSDRLPLSIANYVIRTRDSIVLDAADQVGRFTQDPYIIRHQLQSVLCAPILFKGKLTGLVYLENNLVQRAFTRDRLALLSLITSQAAISIENAQLYGDLKTLNETLEQQVAQRTQELSETLANLQTAQKQLVESEKMAALGSLVAGVAHEINTPIGIGVTAASTLADKTNEFAAVYQSGKMKRSELERFLTVAEQSSHIVMTNLARAAELIHSFKQIAVDQSSEIQRTFELKGYLEEVIVSLSPELDKTGHTIWVNGDESLEIDSYPGALAQVIANLVMNSIIHAYEVGDRGTIRIEFQATHDCVTLHYSDDGCGISEEYLDRIFEPFFTTKRGQGGTGLGLHIVYNLVVQRLQGSIVCESQLGQGTRFTICLPLRLTSGPSFY